MKVEHATPRSAIVAQVLILINAAFWLIFSLLATLGQLPGILSTGPARWVMGVLSFGAAVFLGGLVFFLARGKKAAYYIGLVTLVLMSILSITDEVGLFDWLILIISLAALVLLVINRSWYLGSSSTEIKDG